MVVGDVTLAVGVGVEGGNGSRGENSDGVGR